MTTYIWLSVDLRQMSATFLSNVYKLYFKFFPRFYVFLHFFVFSIWTSITSTVWVAVVVVWILVVVYWRHAGLVEFFVCLESKDCKLRAFVDEVQWLDARCHNSTSFNLLVTYSSQFTVHSHTIHRTKQRRLSLSSPNINRCSKLFHWHTVRTIYIPWLLNIPLRLECKCC